jgi:hypothetical protein
MADFSDSLKKIVLGTVRGIVMSAEERERTAFRESGHALLGMLTPGANPVRRPWSAAGLLRYGWAAGVPLTGPGQVVLTAPVRYRPGDQVTVQTAAGPRRLVVNGVIRTDAAPAMYETDAAAAAAAGGSAPSR